MPTSEEEAAAKAVADAKAAEVARAEAARESEKSLVRMTKQGEKPLRVHPTAVEAHRAVGWKLAE